MSDITPELVAEELKSQLLPVPLAAVARLAESDRTPSGSGPPAPSFFHSA